MNQDSQQMPTEALDDEMDIDSDTPQEDDYNQVDEDEEGSTSSDSIHSSTSSLESDSDDSDDEIDFGPEDDPKDMNLSHNLGYSAL